MGCLLDWVIALRPMPPYSFFSSLIDVDAMLENKKNICNYQEKNESQQ